MSIIRQVLRDKAFRIHLIVYASVNLLLAVIDLATSPGRYWFFWPLLGWGIGILGHGLLIALKVRQRPTAG